MKFLAVLAGVVSVFSICASAYAISISDAELVGTGRSKNEVHEILGECVRDVSGLKETYELGGGRLIAQYDSNIFVRGYVIK